MHAHEEEAMPTTPDLALKPLNRLVGTWTTEATHPALPGVVVHGTSVIEWLEGERFMIQRSRTDHPDFPDSISIIGSTEHDRVDAGSRGVATAAGKPELTMHYFDSRGVFRVYRVSADEEALRFWRDAPGFSQRFAGRFADRGDTMAGTWQLCEDDVHWNDDLRITYRRRR
jgi:hypothetical protein